MNTTDTPETDAAQFPVMTWPGRENPLVVRAEVARKLERERNDARDQLTRICQEGFDNQDTKSLETCADYVLRMLKDEKRFERERLVKAMESEKQALDLARRLRDALEKCAFIIGPPGSIDYQEEYECDAAYEAADAALAKAKEVLP